MKRLLTAGFITLAMSFIPTTASAAVYGPWVLGAMFNNNGLVACNWVRWVTPDGYPLGFFVFQYTSTLGWGMCPFPNF